MALVNHRWRLRVLVLIGINLFFLSVAWRLPGFELVNHLPGFSLLLNKCMKSFIPLMLAIVAAIILVPQLREIFLEFVNILFGGLLALSSARLIVLAIVFLVAHAVLCWSGPAERVNA